MTDISTTVDASARQMSFRRASNAYDGRPPAPLTPRQGEPDDNLIISLARTIVDKGAAFLFGKDVLSQVTGPQPEPKQDYLDDVWRRNKRGLTLQKLATNGGIYGHAFVRLLESTPTPRVVVLDSSCMQVITNPDDLDDVWRLTYTPPAPAPLDEHEDAPPQRRIVIQNPSGTAGRLVNAPVTWDIVEQYFTGGAWIGESTQRWPYPFCPIIHCQNLPKPNDLWGEADLPEDILKILDGINRISSQIGKILRIHSHPKVWSRGMGKANIDIAVDSVITMPSETAELRILEMQSDLGSSLAFLDKLLNLLSMMCRIPLVAMGMPDNLGAISGVALQIRYQPLLEKTEAKQRSYGDLITEVDRCLLTMGGFAEPLETNLVWPPVMPTDALQERQVMVLDDQLGLVSKETLSTKAGYDWASEQPLIAAEHADAVAAGAPAQADTALEAKKLEPGADVGAKADGGVEA